MNKLRSLIFWLHLALGVSAGAVILVMSVTGVLLTYQRQITQWAETRHIDGSPPAADAVRLPPAELLAIAREAHEGEPTAIRWQRDPDAPVEVLYGRAAGVYLNGYTGKVLEGGAPRTREFFRQVTMWHRWLAGTGDWQPRFRLLTFAATFFFCLIIASGFWLWWPRNLTWPAIRSVLWFRRGLRPKARDFNWHHVLGFWMLIPLAIIAFSGVVISSGRISDALQTVIGDGILPSVQAPDTVPTAPPTPAQLALVLASAQRAVPEWKSLVLQLEPVRGGAVRVSADRGAPGQPQHRHTLLLDAQGTVLHSASFGDRPRGTRARDILRFAHTGEILGVPGQTAAGIVTAGAVLLVWTGIALALRRYSSWRKRRVQLIVGGSPPPRVHRGREIAAGGD